MACHVEIERGKISNATDCRGRELQPPCMQPAACRPPRQLSGRGYCNQTREEEEAGEDSVRTEQQCRTRKVMNKEVSRVILARKVAHAAVTRPRIPDATIENARHETWGSQDETAGLTSFLAINLCVVQAAPGQRKMRRRPRRRRRRRRRCSKSCQAARVFESTHPRCSAIWVSLYRSLILLIDIIKSNVQRKLGPIDKDWVELRQVVHPYEIPRCGRGPKRVDFEVRSASAEAAVSGGMYI